MCTPPSEVTHACLLDLDSTASRSRHGSLLCPVPQAQAIRVSPYQICAHQAFACQNRHHRRAPRPPARKTQKYGQPKASHAPQLALENYHAPPQILDFQIVFVYMCRHDGLLVHRFTWLENLVVKRCRTRLHAPPGFLTSPPRASEHARSCHAPKSAADVI